MNYGDLNFPQNEEERITLTDLAISKLDSLRKWAMFFAVLGFIFIGLGIISMISFAFFGLSETLAPMQMNSGMPMTMLSTMNIVVTAVLIAIYFFPILYMYRFSVRTKKAIMENSSASFEQAIKALNAHFQFVGVLTIILLSLYIFIIAIAIIFGTMLN